MALSNGAGGYQLGDGNLAESTMGYSAAPQTATATATLTAAQVLGGILYANPSTSAATYTLPTGSDIDAALPSANVGNTFDLSIVNVGTSSGTVTLSMGTGLTDGGNATVALAVTSSGRFRFRRTAAATWSVYRIA